MDQRTAPSTQANFVTEKFRPEHCPQDRRGGRVLDKYGWPAGEDSGPARESWFQSLQTHADYDPNVDTHAAMGQTLLFDEMVPALQGRAALEEAATDRAAYLQGMAGVYTPMAAGLDVPANAEYSSVPRAFPQPGPTEEALRLRERSMGLRGPPLAADPTDYNSSGAQAAMYTYGYGMAAESGLSGYPPGRAVVGVGQRAATPAAPQRVTIRPNGAAMTAPSIQDDPLAAQAPWRPLESVSSVGRRTRV